MKWREYFGVDPEVQEQYSQYPQNGSVRQDFANYADFAQGCSPGNEPRAEVANAPATPLPYIDKGGSLVIPFDADPIFQYWKGGMTLPEVLVHLDVPPEVIRRHIPQTLLEGLEERAAIMEYDANLGRTEAERQALLLLVERLKGEMTDASGDEGKNSVVARKQEPSPGETPKTPPMPPWRGKKPRKKYPDPFQGVFMFSWMSK